MHISYALHSLDCNLADREYVLIPEQGTVQEEDQEQAPEAAIEDLPTAPASHPGFGAPRPGREHNHQVCWDQVSHI
jgi:hypothetical protein